MRRAVALLLALSLTLPAAALAQTSQSLESYIYGSPTIAPPFSSSAMVPVFSSSAAGSVQKVPINSIGGSLPTIPGFSVLANTTSSSGQPQGYLPYGTTGNSVVLQTLGSGLISASVLPSPTASTLGGVESLSQQTNQWIYSITTGGQPLSSQPGFGNLSGTLAPSQCPLGTASAFGCLEVGSNLAVSGGVVSLSTTIAGAPTFSGQPSFTGSLTGTQTSCLGLSSAGALVASSGACGSSGSGLVVGSTTITGGTTGDLLYDNDQILGEEGLGALLASPPAIGGTTPASGAFTTLSSTSTVTLGDLSGCLQASAGVVSGTGSSCGTSTGLSSFSIGVGLTHTAGTQNTGSQSVNSTDASLYPQDWVCAYSSNHTVASSDGCGTYVADGSGSFTFSLPAASSAAGESWRFSDESGYGFVLSSSAGGSFYGGGASGSSFTAAAGTGAVIRVTSDGTNWDVGAGYASVTVDQLPTVGTWSFGGTISGDLTFSGVPVFSGSLTGTQVSCLGLDSGDDLAASAGLCATTTGLTTGQIPVATGSTTLNGSIAYGTTGTDVLLEVGGAGTISPSVLPTPTATTLGGIESYTCSTNQVFNALSTGGAFSCVQLNFTSLSGAATVGQLPTSGTWDFGGTLDLTGTFELSGTAVSSTAAQLNYLGEATGTTGTTSTNVVFSTSPSLTTPTIAGAALSGTLSGSPTFSGDPTFSGIPVLSGLSSGTCSNGLAVNSDNDVVEVSCPGSSDNTVGPGLGVVGTPTTTTQSVPQSSTLIPNTATTNEDTDTTITTAQPNINFGADGSSALQFTLPNPGSASGNVYSVSDVSGHGFSLTTTGGSADFYGFTGGATDNPSVPAGTTVGCIDNGSENGYGCAVLYGDFARQGATVNFNSTFEIGGYSLSLGGDVTLPAAPGSTECLQMSDTGSITTTGSTCGGSTTITLAPGLGDSQTSFNGTSTAQTVTNSSTLYPQLASVTETSSYTLNARCSSDILCDTATLVLSDAASLTFKAPNPAGTLAPYQIADAAGDPFTVTTVSGTATFYGCVSGSPTSFTVPANYSIQLSDQGSTNNDYYCVEQPVTPAAPAGLTHFDLGYISGVNPNGAVIVAYIPTTLTVTSIYGIPTAASGTSGTDIDVYEAPSGTACSSGTKMDSTSFNADGTANTQQSMGVNTNTITASDYLCFVTSGTWTSSTGVGTITVWAHP